MASQLARTARTAGVACQSRQDGATAVGAAVRSAPAAGALQDDGAAIEARVGEPSAALPARLTKQRECRQALGPQTGVQDAVCYNRLDD
jgi:hypothetical protein